jgi:hypothetical protein
LFVLYSVDQIHEEKDSNELKYDEKELLEIEANRKERLQEILKNRKNNNSGRCRAWCWNARAYCCAS